MLTTRLRTMEQFGGELRARRILGPQYGIIYEKVLALVGDKPVTYDGLAVAFGGIIDQLYPAQDSFRSEVWKMVPQLIACACLDSRTKTLAVAYWYGSCVLSRVLPKGRT